MSYSFISASAMRPVMTPGAGQLGRHFRARYRLASVLRCDLQKPPTLPVSLTRCLMRRRLPTLVLSIGLLGGLPWVAGAETVTAPVNAQTAAQLAPAAPSELPRLPPRQRFDDILARPLFSEGRRPEAVDNSAPASSAAELKENWRLTGIVIVGTQTKALLQQRNGDRLLSLTVGMPLDGSWMLERIENRAVVMDSGLEQARLELLEPRPTEPIVSSPAAPAAAADGGGEPATAIRPLEERVREAARRVQQETQQALEVPNEQQ